MSWQPSRGGYHRRLHLLTCCVTWWLCAEAETKMPCGGIQLKTEPGLVDDFAAPKLQQMFGGDLTAFRHRLTGGRNADALSICSQPSPTVSSGGIPLPVFSQSGISTQLSTQLYWLPPERIKCTQIIINIQELALRVNKCSVSCFLSGLVSCQGLLIVWNYSFLADWSWWEAQYYVYDFADYSFVMQQKAMARVIIIIIITNL